MNAAQWNELIKGDNASRVYHLYEWGALLEEAHGYQLFYLAEDNGRFPLALVKSPLFGKRLISLPFADYGGPCAWDKETVEAMMVRCEEVAQETGVDFVEIRAPREEHFGILKGQGFTRRDDYLTFILPLDQEPEELWKGIGERKRNKVRKAQKKGVTLREAGGKADLGTFYRLYLKTMKRLGSPPQPYKFFQRMWELFYPQNLLMPMAIYEGRCIAAGIFLLHNRSIHHAYSCSLEDYLNVAPNNLIGWHVIQWGHEHGFRYLDFGRTRENEGTLVFKQYWGGHQVKMPYFYKFYKRELRRRQEIQYKRLSQLWAKYLPDFLANRIGPWIIKQVG